MDTNCIFTSGETIKIMCEFSNASTRNATPTASLMQHEKYSTLAGSRKMDNKSLDSATGELVKGGNLQAYSEMTLTIPDTTFLSVSNCSIIEVVYTVLVGINMRCNFQKFRVLFLVKVSCKHMKIWSVRIISSRNYQDNCLLK